MPQPASKKHKSGNTATFGPVITDSRFVNLQSDPRYRLPGRKQQVKLDKRFAKTLHDDDFSRKAKVDRYGRPVHADAEKNRLKRKYVFDDEDETLVSGSDEADRDEVVLAELNRVTESRDLLREGKDMSTSEEETSSDEDTDDEEEVKDTGDAGPGVRDQDVLIGEVSSRIAVVNLDWDNIRAEDLMAVFQSFLPSTGRLLKVAIYPSEFGKERIEREEMEGPPKEIFAKIDQETSDIEAFEDDEDVEKSIVKPDDGSEFDSTALRQYQLERLRYYYAILTFSDSVTAKAIYDTVDGAEYLSTANFFDLRFVPDNVSFTDDSPREECERIPAGYKPNEFVTDALQHSKVKLTWDADDATRKEAQARAFRRGPRDVDDNDLKAYLGTDSETDEGNEDRDTLAAEGISKKDAERQRMRALLGLDPEPTKISKRAKSDVPLGNIQITFSSGLSRKAGTAEENADGESGPRTTKNRGVFENSPEPDETLVEKYVRKEKERKQRRKAKVKAHRNGTNDALAADRSDVDEQANLGFEDPFFTEPTHDAQSVAKQRKAERVKRRAEREAEEIATAKHRAELEKLMIDDDNDEANDNSNKQGHTVKHFDMREIEKAEKAMKKKAKKNKKGQDTQTNTKPFSTGESSRTAHGDDEAVLANDDFELDTADPRFAPLYENPDFAIDPTNPRFEATRVMKTLRGEVRRRKDIRPNANVGAGGRRDQKVDADRARPQAQEIKGKRARVTASGDGDGDGDGGVMGLVQKIKSRSNQ